MDVETERALREFFRPRAKHCLSAALPATDSREGRGQYVSMLAEYQADWRAFAQYNESHRDSAKADFLYPDNGNIAWKVHLNAMPKDVETISKYLRTNGYLHKYLSGGEIEDGKTFTVYIGSFRLTQRLANRLSGDLVAFLARPKARREIEFARGVVGRFCGERGKFRRYGSSGLSHLDDETTRAAWKKARHSTAAEGEEIMQALEPAAFRKAKELYGNYFFDMGSVDDPPAA